LIARETPAMRAMVLEAAGTALRLVTREVPRPAPHQVLVRVHACGVCRTDLHVVDGDLAGTRYPIVPAANATAASAMIPLRPMFIAPVRPPASSPSGPP
jgi:hypothetical protein